MRQQQDSDDWRLLQRFSVAAATCTDPDELTQIARKLRAQVEAVANKTSDQGQLAAKSKWLLCPFRTWSMSVIMRYSPPCHLLTPSSLSSSQRATLPLVIHLRTRIHLSMSRCTPCPPHSLSPSPPLPLSLSLPGGKRLERAATMECMRAAAQLIESKATFLRSGAALPRVTSPPVDKTAARQRDLERAARLQVQQWIFCISACPSEVASSLPSREARRCCKRA